MINIINLSEKIELWNEKLNTFFAKYTDNPWAGTIIFIVLLVFGWSAVSSFSKK